MSEPFEVASWQHWADLKTDIVYVVACQLIDEHGYATVGTIKTRLEDIDRPLIAVTTWLGDGRPGLQLHISDHNLNHIRNALNRLTRQRPIRLLEVPDPATINTHRYPKLRWIHADTDSH